MVRPGFKQTEAGVLPDDWKAVRLGPHVQIQSGESPSLFDFKRHGVPYFKVEQLNNTNKYLKDTPYFIQTVKRIPRGSLIFPKRGASVMLNKVRILDQESFMDTNLMTLCPTHCIHREYLYYTITHIELWRIADTTSIPQINNKHIVPLVIPLPPTMAEQEAIATALSDVDALIEALEQLIAKKRRIKQGAMQELLTGKRRLPGFEGDWVTRGLGDLGDLVPGEYLPQPYQPGRYPVQGAGGRMGWHHQPNQGRPVCVIGRVGTVGRPRFLPAGCWVNNNAAAIIARKQLAMASFLYFLLLSVPWDLMTSTTAQPFLEVNLLLELQFAVPSLDEQEAIAAVLSEMDTAIETLEAKLTKTRQLKQGMMHELLTGRIRLI